MKTRMLQGRRVSTRRVGDMMVNSGHHKGRLHMAKSIVESIAAAVINYAARERK